MGDRTWLKLYVIPDDVPTVVERVGEPTIEDTDDSGVASLFYEQANYGGTRELWDADDALCKAGISFSGAHGAGGEYPPYVFVSLDGARTECFATEEEDPVAIVIWDGDRIVPHPDDLMAARRYLEDRKRFDALVSARTRPSTDDQAG